MILDGTRIKIYPDRRVLLNKVSTVDFSVQSFPILKSFLIQWMNCPDKSIECPFKNQSLLFLASNWIRKHILQQKINHFERNIYEAMFSLVPFAGASLTQKVHLKTFRTLDEEKRRKWRGGQYVLTTLQLKIAKWLIFHGKMSFFSLLFSSFKPFSFRKTCHMSFRKTFNWIIDSNWTSLH